MFEFDENIVKELETPLTAYQLEGKGYNYAKISEVIDKLNKVFKYTWSSKIINMNREGDYIIAVVELSVEGVFKQGVGGDRIKVYAKGKPNAGEPVDLSNSYASAIASAIKNAAKQFGIKIGENGQVSARPAKKPTFTNKPPMREQSKPASKTPPPQKKVSMDLIEQTANNVANALRNNKTVFPSAADQATTPISSTQLRAVSNMSSQLKLSPVKAIQKALGESNKQSFEELTMGEAATLIKTLNSLRREGNF